MTSASPVDQLLRLRQHQRAGHRSPHKPLLALLALGRLATAGSSALTWSEVEEQLADLLAEFGPGSTARRTQSAAYPFTRLRSDGVWELDRDVPMDLVGPLRGGVTGRFDSALETELASDPAVLRACAQALALSQFPADVAADVLLAVGLDVTVAGVAEVDPEGRRRDPVWRRQVLQAWDGSCAFRGFDGQVAGSAVGIEAAHVRWFAFGGPDTLDNGLALCMLHHKLFDRGVLGLDDRSTIRVSAVYSARTDAGRAVYDLHGRVLAPRPGTAVPAPEHVAWHRAEVFRGTALVA
jgi:putative restriction endonuclease